MTNAEKFKTAQERAEAFRKWYIKECHAEDDYVSENDCFAWLELEAEVANTEINTVCSRCFKKVRR